MQIDGGFALALVVSGALMIPTLGIGPLIAVGAAIALSLYIADNFRLK